MINWEDLRSFNGGSDAEESAVEVAGIPNGIDYLTGNG